ncbi:TPA: hypothetical protein MCI70_001662 [Klebsiella pneumoniae]|nr:hypothetical protein HMPREF1619_05524 [Klebsiella pneumoniae 909957]KSX52215.1 hypothetical protein APT86_01410 [Klebsiella pneumoniae]PIJ22242.1 hypothetical protein C630_25870 [Klebsiella pneumoniae subsp. pneumoniae KpO3210]MBA1596837.1 hypothetical protein [Klebsiella pneumoniae]MBK0575319.1 hypothetical protein [Klebsiella pneumoniae]
MVIAINKLLMRRAIFCCPFLFLRITVGVLSLTRKKYSISVFFSE